jgi:hypothetical protein
VGEHGFTPVGETLIVAKKKIILNENAVYFFSGQFTENRHDLLNGTGIEKVEFFYRLPLSVLILGIIITGILKPVEPPGNHPGVKPERLGFEFRSKTVQKRINDPEFLIAEKETAVLFPVLEYPDDNGIHSHVIQILIPQFAIDICGMKLNLEFSGNRGDNDFPAFQISCPDRQPGQADQTNEKNSNPVTDISQ